MHILQIDILVVGITASSRGFGRIVEGEVVVAVDCAVASPLFERPDDGLVEDFRGTGPRNGVVGEGVE